MIGRTHGVHAEPMTFGLKLALWYAELQRDLDRVLRARETRRGRQDLRRRRHVRAPRSVDRGARSASGSGSQPAPVSSQVIQRDRHAELMTRARDHRRVAREVRARDPRPAEDRDRRGRGAVRQGAEGLVGDAAQAQPDRLRADHRPGAAGPRQRDGGARERRALARARHLALVGRARDPARQLHRARSHAAALHADRRAAWSCYPERMRENLERSRGVVFSGTVLLELARRGVSREQAYEWVQRNAMRSFHEQRTSRRCCSPIADVMQRADAGRDRAGVRSRRAAAQRRRDLRPRVRAGRGAGDRPAARAGWKRWRTA